MRLANPNDVVTKIRIVGKKDAEKIPQASTKSFMAVGPTLHYSHENVLICWFLAVMVYTLCCLFWSKIATGSFAAFDAVGPSVGPWAGLFSPDAWHLDRFVLSGVSILEYPWQILVLGLLMGVLGIAPILVAQLMSFSHSLPFIMGVVFLANLPGVALSLLISCLGVACRPLRFRSRIIAIALCMAPLLVYWGAFGGAREYEALLWGFSFAPWVCAWLVGLVVAGIVLAIGHFTRYKPGLIWITTGLFLSVAVGVFEAKIGFNELAYQLYVAKNNPEEAPEFHDNKITDDLDRLLKDPKVMAYLNNFFYPKESILLREELKQELVNRLAFEEWPAWVFAVPEDLDFQRRRRQLNQQYNLFIDPDKSWWMPEFFHRQLLKRRMASKRMAVALYYKGVLSEFSPDIAQLKEKEVLHFYWDYPRERSRAIWYRLLQEFPESPEALEAYWRVAMHWAGQGRFEQASQQLEAAKLRLNRVMENMGESFEQAGTVSRLFRVPSQTIMTKVKLEELQTRLDRLLSLIRPENRGTSEESELRLAQFVKLNPHTRDYPRQLDTLMSQLDAQDGLRDNVELALVKLFADDQLREERLAALHRSYAGTDGGIEALFELARLRTYLYRAQSDLDMKQERLQQAISTLESFLTLYPESRFGRRARVLLSNLPGTKPSSG